MGKFKNISGQKFGLLTVVDFNRMSTQGSTWNCLCECGTYVVRPIGSLGINLSCGCLRKAGIRDKLLIDMTGQKCGKWTVVRMANSSGESDGGHTKWICECECGNISAVDGKTLRRGNSTQCISCRNKKSKKKTDEPLYRVWRGMKNRCSLTNLTISEDYAGRGIFVCEEWRNSYDTFKKWAIDHGYVEKSRLTIERIDNDAGYSPDNCRFATFLEQSRNKRNNHLVSIDGKEFILKDALCIAKTPYATYKTRIRLGWTEHDAIWGKKTSIMEGK